MPGPSKIIGYDEYCREPTCQWHVIALRTKGAKDDPQPHERCPQNHPAGVIAIPIHGAAPLSDDSGPVHEVVVLPARPYGGFILQLGDDDGAPKWEGGVAAPAVARPPSDPQHTGARYVAELQRDLIQLGYLSQARWKAPGGQPWSVFEAGKFTMPVAAAVLTLKADLAGAKARGYGVATRAFLQGVNEAPSADKSPLNPDVNAPYPIFFDPQLRNPRTLEIVVKAGELKSTAALFDALANAAKTWTGLKSHLVYPAKVTVSYSLPADGGQPPAASSVEASTIDEESAAIDKLIDELHGLEAGASARREAAIQGAVRTLVQRRTRLAGVKSDAGRFANALGAAAHAINAQLNPVLETYASIKPPPLVARSTIAWNVDAERAATRDQVLAEIKQNGVDVQQAHGGQLGVFVTTCDDIVATVKALPGLAASVPQFQDLPAAAQTARDTVGALVDKIKNADIPAAMTQYRVDLREFARVDPATAYCIKKMVAERSLNGRPAYVGPETSEMIEWVATVTLADGTTVTRNVGFKPLAKEPAVCEALLKQAAVDVLKVDLAAEPMAFKIFYAMLVNESGWVQFGGDFQGLKYITMGIDWLNVVVPEGTGLKAFLFDEFTTEIPGYAMNRGWGLSQNSPGTSTDRDRSLGYVKRVPGSASEDHSEPPETAASYPFFNGLPAPPDDDSTWPASIAHPKTALAFTMNHIRQKFTLTKRKLRCSFPTEDKPSFECGQCMARFTPADFVDTDKLRAIWKSVPFEDDLANRARVDFQTSHDGVGKKDADLANFFSKPDCQAFIRAAFAAQDQADNDAASTDAAAALEARRRAGEKNVPTLEDYKKTAEFKQLVVKKHADAVAAFHATGGPLAPLPEAPPSQITSAITPAAFEKAFGRRPLWAYECVEMPCSWPAARAFYAGRSKEGLTHAPEVVKDVKANVPP